MTEIIARSVSAVDRNINGSNKNRLYSRDSQKERQEHRDHGHEE